jgi:hypothetical protein
MGQEGAEITAYDISQFAAEGGEPRPELDTPQTTSSAEQPPDGKYGNFRTKYFPFFKNT